MAEREPSVITSIREFKAGLLAREADQVNAMARRWLEVERALEANILTLTNDIDLMKRNGETVTRTKLLNLDRTKKLLAQTRVELAKYADYATDLVTREQARYAADGIQHARTATQLSLGLYGEVNTYFDVLPVSATENMVGLAGDGSPLSKLMKTGFGEAATGMLDQMIQSTARGVNPRDTARNMRTGLSTGLNRVLTIARTEQLRVYREASRMQYQQAGYISGYKRISAKDSRTCPACLFADGRLYDLGTSFQDHPNGRCALVPIVKGKRPIEWETGETWFRKQSPDLQREVLGGDYFDAWKDGAFDLKDLVTVHNHPTWGGSLQVTPLKDLIGA